MKHYTVHARSDAAPDDVRFVKDGFSWPAFIVPLAWLIVKAQWLWLVLYLLALALATAVVTAGNVTGDVFGLVAAALSLLMGLEANDIYRRSLERRGFSFLGSAAGSDLEAAELQFFGDAGRIDGRSAPPPGGGDVVTGDDLRGLA